MTLVQTLVAAAAASTLIATAGTASARPTAENPTTPPPKAERQAPEVEQNLKVFDTLDFDVFSNQKWDRLHESHANDIVVTWPDGHETKGIDKMANRLPPPASASRSAWPRSATGRTARWTTSGCSGITRTS